MDHTFLPINIGDNNNHSKSTHGFLHRIILNNSSLSDKYKSITIINNTINYNDNIKEFDDNLFKGNKKNNLSKKIDKNKKSNSSKNINNDIDSDFSEISKSISPSQQKKRIDNLKSNLKSEYKEAKNIQNAKSVSSHERENEKIQKNKNIGYMGNDDIIGSEKIIVNIEEISSSNKINEDNNEENINNNEDYIAENNNIFNSENNLKEKSENDKSTQNIDDIINTKEKNIKIKPTVKIDGYNINFDSPNKGANLVKKGRKKISKINLDTKFKNDENNIIKLYKLNDTMSNDIIFFFVNEDTNKGMKLLNLEYRNFVQNINGKQITIYIFDMNNKTENNKMNDGIKILLAELALHKIVKVVLGCGDESIFPFIEKLNNYSINFDKIIFCALPFGRSNDLSTQFGFGKSISKINLNTLKKIIIEIVESISVSIDIWEIKLTFDGANGGYISINNNSQKYQKKTSSMRRGFISYFSLGYDSRIGFDISKNKYNQSKVCYYLSFWYEAIKKYCCTKSLKLNQFLDSLYYINLHKNENLYEDENQSQTIREDNGQKITIFQTNVIDINLNGNDNISINNSKSENRIVSTNEPINKKSYKKAHNITNEEDEENEIEESDSETEYEEVNSTLKTFKCEKIMIKGEPLGLICQNIKYFCDGNISKWDCKKPKYGIQIRKKMSTDSINKSNKELKKVRNYIIYKYFYKIGQNAKR